jgi:phosphoserine aminotransferase
MTPFVQDTKYQSKTVIVADCANSLPGIKERLISQQLIPGFGYGSYKSSHLRFANFPAHSKEQFELLVDALKEN